MRVQINLGTKFQLKLTISIFWTKFATKGYYRSKTEKQHFCICPWSLVTTLNFPYGGRQTQQYFNVSSPSSRRNKNKQLVVMKKEEHAGKIVLMTLEKNLLLTTLKKKSLSLRKTKEDLITVKSKDNPISEDPQENQDPL